VDNTHTKCPNIKHELLLKTWTAYTTSHLMQDKTVHTVASTCIAVRHNKAWDCLLTPYQLKEFTQRVEWNVVVIMSTAKYEREISSPVWRQLPASRLQNRSKITGTFDAPAKIRIEYLPKADIKCWIWTVLICRSCDTVKWLIYILDVITSNPDRSIVNPEVSFVSLSHSKLCDITLRLIRKLCFPVYYPFTFIDTN